MGGISKAEAVVVDLGIRSDAVLRWPTSIIISTALSVTLNEHLGHMHLGQTAGDGADAHRFSDVLGSVLHASVGTESEQAALKDVTEQVRSNIQLLATKTE